MDEDKKLRVVIREELKKLSGMTWGKRLGYIWDYYKPLLAAILGIVAAIYIGVTIYHNLQQIDVIQVYMIDSNALDIDTEEIAAEFGEFLGGLKKNEVVTIDTSLTEDEDDVSQYAMASRIKVMALTSGGGMDMMLLKEDVYEKYLEEGMLQAMDDILTEEQKEKWSGRLIGDSGRIYGVDVQDSPVLERYNAYFGEKVYAVVSVNAAHLEKCDDFLEFIL